MEGLGYFISRDLGATLKDGQSQTLARAIVGYDQNGQPGAFTGLLAILVSVMPSLIFSFATSQYVEFWLVHVGPSVPSVLANLRLVRPASGGSEHGKHPRFGDELAVLYANLHLPVGAAVARRAVEHALPILCASGSVLFLAEVVLACFAGAGRGFVGHRNAWLFHNSTLFL